MSFKESVKEFLIFPHFKYRTVNKAPLPIFAQIQLPLMLLENHTMELSALMTRFSEPETLRMAKLGRELRAKGFDIIDLSLGEPDFDTPEHIKEAAKKAIDDNFSHYTPVSGYLDLKEAVCHKF